MQPSKEQEPTPSNPLIKSILKTLFIAHLVLSIIYTTYLIVTNHNLLSFTITFVMLIIYGYLGVWIWVIGFLLVLCKSYERATIFSRIFVKFIIICYPIFAILSISKEGELHSIVHLFIIYMGIVTLLLIVYEVASCFCYEDKYPLFLFVENDLTNANAEVLSKRKQYNELISSL